MQRISIKEALHVSTRRLQGITDIPHKEAMILLCEALGKEMSWLMAHEEDSMSIPQSFFEMLQRRTTHEPLEYILGRASFYSKIFEVDKRVLIPRPETELLVDKALELARGLKTPYIVEIGCGSGIVSIMLSLLLPSARITAVDISQEALHVSRKNAKLHGVEERICFVHGSYLDGVHEEIDMIVSNPPYIANNEPLGEGLSFEPSIALYGGNSGDEMLCHIIDLFVEKKAKALVCEMGYDQKASLGAYAQTKGLKAHFYQDLAGLDRGFWIKELR